jgi:hypothetical protein
MLRITVLLAMVVISVECHAQKNIPQESDTTKYWRIGTSDDNEFFGKIIKAENGMMTLQTDKFGTITIRFLDIRSIEEADPKKMVGNVYWPENFQSTRYFWLPNGFGLKRGEAYYQNVWIMFNQFTVGVTDKFSLTAGLIPTFLLGGKVAPVWVNGKFSLPIGKRAQFGTGVVYLRIMDLSGDKDGGGGGVAYGVLTLGSRDHSISFGAGYGFSGGRVAERPVITLAASTRLGPRGYLMSENYIFPFGHGDGFGLLSIGGRRMLKRVGLDFGGFMPVTKGLQTVFIIPWLGFSAPLGKQRPTD